jgi:hypothetical protein
MGAPVAAAEIEGVDLQAMNSQHAAGRVSDITPDDPTPPDRASILGR